MTRRVRILAALLAMLLVSACGSATPQGQAPAAKAPAPAQAAPTALVVPPPQTAPPTQAAPAAKATAAPTTPQTQVKRGGTFRVGTYNEPPNLDPFTTTNTSTRQMMSLVYDTLVELNEKSEIVPNLAESWEVKDGKVYTFRLRKGAKFHNGRAVTSADVKWSFERIANPATKSPRKDYFDPVDAIETPDDSTVVIRLKYPFAPLLNYLGEGWTSIVAKETADKGFDNGGIGSGPFKFVEFRPGQHVKLARNPDYWAKDKPYVDEILFEFIPDDNARTAALKSGRIDFMYRTNPGHLEGIKADKTLKVVGGTVGNYRFLVLNQTIKPFDDPRVRQAVAWAIDRQQVTDMSVDGFGYPLPAGPIPPGHWAELKEPVYPKRDLDKARALLKEAGVTGPVDLTITMGQFVNHINSGQAIAQHLKALGWNVKVEPVDNTINTRNQATGNFQAYIHGHAGMVDPDAFLWLRVHSTGARNAPVWSDKQMDALLEKGRAESDPKARLKIYDEAQRYAALNSPTIFLYSPGEYESMKDYVMGFKFMFDEGFTSFREVWLNK